MKITVFTSNQPRHIYLINKLASVFDEVYAIQECNTVFPGETKDLFDDSDCMKRYFERVRQAEIDLFGTVSFVNNNVRTLSLRRGDLNRCSEEMLSAALDSQYYLVFGSSYIKGWLIDFLISHKAINIHMGLSPYYRGSACNFWALYDNMPEMVGASIILLSKGLDSGRILYHALPCAREVDGFELGMDAVRTAISSVVSKLEDGSIDEFVPIEQDRSKEIRYSRVSEFSDTIANNYMHNMMNKEIIMDKLQKRTMDRYYNPCVM